jgi:hypothetical protein
MLLFAIVLGLAAMAAALTRPPAQRRTAPSIPPPPALAQREAKPAAQVRFDTALRARTRNIQAGRRTVVTVDVEKPGQVELAGLGLTAAAEPLTPAHFDLLAVKAGRYEVHYTPAGELASRRAGVLRVSSGSASGAAGSER